MTTYEIRNREGTALTRVQADYHTTLKDGSTRLYRDRRIIWDKRVYTTKPSESVFALMRGDQTLP